VPYYAYTTNWQQGVKVSTSLGTCEAANENEARGIAVTKGQEVNPTHQMAGLLVLPLVDMNKFESCLEEIARMLGFDPANNPSLDEVMIEVRKKLAP
jgi:hypothetical protein